MVYSQKKDLDLYYGTVVLLMDNRQSNLHGPHMVKQSVISKGLDCHSRHYRHHNKHCLQGHLLSSLCKLINKYLLV